MLKSSDLTLWIHGSDGKYSRGRRLKILVVIPNSGARLDGHSVYRRLGGKEWR
jgi:hypothetical protein